MKKLLILVLMILVVLLPSVFAKSYSISALKYSVEIPNTYSIKNQYISSREQYFAAHHPNEEIVFTVTSLPYTGNDFNSLKNSEIVEMGRSLREFYKEYGITLINYGARTINSQNYLVIECDFAGQKQIQYSTVRNGKFTNFTFTCKSITTSRRTEIETIMNTVKCI